MIARFKTDVNKPVLIISYERTASNIEALKTISVDLLVCDEAHRLKNVSGSKTLAALSQISCGGRRVLLTGTPIQNKYLRAAFATSDNDVTCSSTSVGCSLLELFSLCNFCAPGKLGTVAKFKGSRGADRPWIFSRDHCDVLRQITSARSSTKGGT